jgi:peptide/nickel transport system permease protein
MARAVAATPAPALVQSESVRRRPSLHLRAYPQLVIGSAVLVILLLGAGLGPLLVPYGPTDTDFSATLRGPSWAHVLGTDQLGRDSLSRALAGARLSMLVAAGAVVLGLAGGVPLGVISAMRRGWLSDLIVRVMDGILAFPGLILAMAIAFVLGPSVFTVIVALAVVRLPSVAGVIRAQASGLGQSDYIESARSVGASPTRIAVVHVLPNVSSTILVLASLGAGAAIFTEASLSFLGAGVPPPTATWGGMLHDAYPYLEKNPWQTFVPGVCIFLAVLACNFVGDGLRDFLDPKERTRRG